MKKILMTTVMLFSAASFGNSITDKLPGTYAAEGNCQSEMKIQNEGDSLTAYARRESGEFLFSARIPLETGGQVYDCRHGGSYGQVECRIREKKKSITLQERGCLIFCGPWHLVLSIEDLGDSRVAVKWTDQQAKAYIYQKSTITTQGDLI